MVAQSPEQKGPFYKELFAPFRQNVDDALSVLSANEYPLLESFVEHQKRLWPLFLIDGPNVGATGVDLIINSFTLPDTTVPNVIFTQAGSGGGFTVKMWTVTVSSPGSWTVTEITAAGGSTNLKADGNPPHNFSVAFVDGSLYIAHDGTGPLRVWDGGATYADVPAPGSGYHNAVKYKPYYLTAQNNALILLGDAAVAVGTQYDVIGSTVTNAQDFTSFGAFYTQLLDTSDVISGGSILAGLLTVYKHDSIIIGTPTGNAASPYSFERYQQSTAQSIGLYGSYTLQNDGGFRDFFLSRYGMVMFDGTSFSMVGAGQDNAILGEYQLLATSNTQVPVSALGAIYTVGSLASNLPLANKPSRYYGIALSGGPTLYLLNVDSLAWTQQTVMTSGYLMCGSMYLANSASPTSSKCIIVGGPDSPMGSCWEIPCITQATISINALSVMPKISIGCGPAIYGVGTHLFKTIHRVWIEFQQTAGLNQQDFSPTVTIDVGSDVSKGAVNHSAAIGTGTAQLGYPATNPTLYTPCVAPFDMNTTSRTPIINVGYPDSPGSNICWPQIVRMVIQYDLGDDQ